jgi:hypothetical protein
VSINLDIVEAIDADGGYAAIRVSGLAALPADPTFRIDPIDDAISLDGDAEWPSGPRRPASVKASEGSFDLVLGPDVLESALLLPGTPVTITINDTPAIAEMVWPGIATRRQRPRRPVIVTEELRHAEREATDEKRRVAAAALAVATARAAAAPQPVPGIETAQKRARRTAGKGAHLAEPVAQDGRVLSGFSQQKPSEISAATLIRKEGGKAIGLPGTALATVTGATPSAAPKPRFARQAMAFGAGLTAAAALVFVLVSFRVIDIHPVGQVAGGTPDVALTLARNSNTLRTVLTTGGISPRGRSITGIDGAAALRLADGHLYGSGDAPRDQGEASFWLRHALSKPIDHESMKWAYTQLGSIYAQPEGFPPDFAKARLLWEIAGALGDPIALCFNAALYEHGLGVPKHKDLARALYERARGVGGCKGG